MASWIFEPGHTSAEFMARHMMVTWVRGHFKNVRGRMEFDPEEVAASSVEVEIEVDQLWTGEAERDAHLKSADFLDAANHPIIRFAGSDVDQVGCYQYQLGGDLTIRGITRPTTLEVRYLGQWQTPFWEDGIDKGPMSRAGFVATTRINRHDFKVSWNSPLEKGGLVVGEEVRITIDAEALRK
jgi:polyisoprenoid-binding protein YceI